MEILFEENKPSTSYLAHKAKERCFWSGEGICEFKYILLDPETIKTGWGMYDGQYHQKWDSVIDLRNTNDNKPIGDWKRSFYVWTFVDLNEVLLWNRQSWGEWVAFSNMLKMFYNQYEQNKPLLPCFKYLESKPVKVGKGETAIPEFEFAGFKPRPENFKLPHYMVEELGANASQVETLKKEEFVKELNEDEIPF